MFGRKDGGGIGEIVGSFLTKKPEVKPVTQSTFGQRILGNVADEIDAARTQDETASQDKLAKTRDAITTEMNTSAQRQPTRSEEIQLASITPPQKNTIEVPMGVELRDK
jgi:hypothetical protein